MRYARPMIAAVLFDLDETLLDRRVSLTGFLADQHGRFAERLGGVSPELWHTRFLALDDRGRVPKSVVYPALLAEFGGDPDLADALLADYRERCCGYAQPVPGALEVLCALREAGLALAIVSNGETAFQHRHVDALGLGRLVDAVLISEQEGLRKPEPALFHRAADRLATAPRNCLFVGDDPAADILGAGRTGMRTAWLRRGARWPESLGPMPGVAIETLPEVLDLLGPGPRSPGRRPPPAAA